MVATAFGVGAFVVYLVWNFYWLSQGRIPGSMLTALTGLPAPTTGGTRSLFYLLDGQWRASLRWNPMTIPLMLLFSGSLLQVARRRALGQRLALSWYALLAVAWALKLVSPRETW